MRCRVCYSPGTDPVPFAVPDGTGPWVRCRACGSDSSGAAYDPGRYGPGLSEDLVRWSGGPERCRDLVRSNCDWFGHHHRPGAEWTFLDVGCGDGAALDVMRDLGWAVHGFDVTRPHYAGPHVTVGPVFHRWLFPHRFAAVLCREVIEHVEAPDLLLHELHGACLPGGLVQVQTPVPLDRYDANVYNPGHLFVVSPVRLEAMLRGAMLEVLDARHWPIGQAHLCRARG